MAVEGETINCLLSVGMNKRVQGYRTNLLGKPKYDDVWLEG